MKNFDNEPIIPLNVESLDGRTVPSVTVDLERGPLPVYMEVPNGRKRVGTITAVTFDGATASVTGVLDDEASSLLGLPGSGLAAEIMTDSGDLRAAQVSTEPAFEFKEYR